MRPQAKGPPPRYTRAQMGHIRPKDFEPLVISGPASNFVDRNRATRMLRGRRNGKESYQQFCIVSL